MEGQTTENERASIIAGSIAIILHLDVVRVDQVPGQKLLEYAVVGAMGKRLHVRRNNPILA